MRTILIIVTLLLSGMLAKAQDIFFPTKKGMVLEYKAYNNKDRETGLVRYTIKDLKESGNNMDITYLIEMIDEKGKPMFKEDITIHKKGDRLYVDMSKFINKAALEEAGGIPGQMEITGNDMEIPSNLKKGDILPDSHIEMAFKMGFMTIKMGAQVTDRVVESVENIKVKAGSFEAYKITSKVSANAMGMKTSSTSAEWLVKGIGMVKSEEYDKKGKLSSYTELVSIKE